VSIAVKLDDLLHDRRMTLTELAERVDMTLANLSISRPARRARSASRRSRQSVRRSRASLATCCGLRRHRQEGTQRSRGEMNTKARVNTEQLQSVSLLMLRINDQGAAIALVFFGFATILQGISS